MIHHSLTVNHMKKFLFFVSTIVMVCACGPSSYKYKSDNVNVGYSEVATDDNNFSVSKRKIDRQSTTYSNMLEYLRGRIPGVVVNSNNTITIRGVGTNSGDTSPLILVEGVQMNEEGLLSLDPNNVDSVEVLKDGSSSIYGVQGANGVIIITLKKQ